MICVGADKMKDLNEKDLGSIYRILKAIDENQIINPSEHWELDYYEHGIIDRKAVKRILKKLKVLLPSQIIKNVDKDILIRKYTWSSEVDERVYSKLESAFNDKKTVEIGYFSVDTAETSKRKIDIYYKNRRYTIGFCHLRNSIRKFRTSRIVSAAVTKEKYTIPEDFDKKEYL